jgi:hypothetical protein
MKLMFVGDEWSEMLMFGERARSWEDMHQPSFPSDA